MNKRIFIPILWNLFLILIPLSAYADMGQIHVSNVQVSESGQKAIILHNMTEEILILGTDLKAETDTGIVRFIPFPAEPQVALAPQETFTAAAKLMDKHQLKFLMASKGGGETAKGVEIRLNRKLGAHDLTILKVTDPGQIRKWVNEYFTRRGLPIKENYPLVESVVEDYVKRGIIYFVLDYVDLIRETRFIEPMAYRFKSREVYYPLKTSNTFGGEGTIDLILITPRTLCNPSLDAYSYSGPAVLGFPFFTQASTSARVSPAELVEIHPDAPAFFSTGNIYIQMLSFYGKYHFENDILHDPAKGADQAYEYKPADPDALYQDWIDSMESDIKR